MKRPLLSPVHEGNDFSSKSQVGFHFWIEFRSYASEFSLFSYEIVKSCCKLLFVSRENGGKYEII